MRILHLCTDAYGGYGGIALYNREWIAALATHPQVEEVVVVPRVIKGALEPIPPRVRFLERAARGRFAYMRALQKMRAEGPFDLVVCAHVNLLPLARLVASAPLLLVYGIEAWKPLRDPLSNRLVATTRGVVATRQMPSSPNVPARHTSTPSGMSTISDRYVTVKPIVRPKPGKALGRTSTGLQPPSETTLNG